MNRTLRAWLRANPGRAICYALLALVLITFAAVVTAGWVLPCMLRIGRCIA